MIRNPLLASLSLVLAFGDTATIEGASIIYSIQSYPSQQNGLTLSGTIITDGTIGPIFAGNINGFTMTVSGPNGFTFSYASGQGEIQTLGFLSTTATGQLEIAGPNSLLEFSSFAKIGMLFPPADPILRWSRGATLSGDQYEAINPTGTILWNDTPPATGSLGGDPWIIGQAVPEPGSLTLALLGIGYLAVVTWARRCRRAAYPHEASLTTDS